MWSGSNVVNSVSCYQTALLLKGASHDSLDLDTFFIPFYDVFP